MEKMFAPPPSVDEKLALVFKPAKPVAVKGDVKVAFVSFCCFDNLKKKKKKQTNQVSVWHTGPKPLVHFWLNTRFHTHFPIVLEKRQVDGSDKDPKCKKFPHDFRVVVDLRSAEPHESMLPLPSDKQDKKKATTSVSGFVIEPSVSQFPVCRFVFF